MFHFVSANRLIMVRKPKGAGTSRETRSDEFMEVEAHNCYYWGDLIFSSEVDTCPRRHIIFILPTRFTFICSFLIKFILHTRILIYVLFLHKKNWALTDILSQSSAIFIKIFSTRLYRTYEWISRRERDMNRYVWYKY